MLTDHRPNITVTGAPMLAAFAAADAGIPLGRPENILISVPLDQIVPSRWQPRQQFDPAALLDLANDIAQHGILTPPIVWQNEDLEWELIAGERRIRACYALYLAGTSKALELTTWITRLAEAGFARWRTDMRQYLLSHVKTAGPHNALATIPCRQIYGATAQLHELALVDNLQRADLTALEEAHALRDLIAEYAYTQRQLADRLGKSQTWISQRLALINLTPAVAQRVAAGEIDSATAREIARLAPAVQEPAIEHLKTHGLKSKAAQNVVAKIIELSSDPAAVAGEPGGRHRAERALAQAGLAALPDPAARQAILLQYAAQDKTGKITPPADDSSRLRDLIALTGIAGPNATRSTVDAVAHWPAVAAATGRTCATCQINTHRDLVGAVNQAARAHNESFRNDETWPQCAPGLTTCRAHTPPGAPVGLPIYFIRAEYITDADRAVVAAGDYGHASVTDVATWAAILQRKYAAEDQAAAQRAERKTNGVVTALTAYITAQQTADFEPGHFWSQPCVNCVFHKTAADDPAQACQYQAQPPVYESYASLIVARLWRSGNAPAIGRCRLFRLKQPWRALLTTLPGAGLDLPVAGMLHTLEQLAAVAYNGSGKRTPAWLDVKRSDPWEPPAWTTAEPVLRTLLSDLHPGQRLALLLLWVDPFGFHPFMSRTNEATAYVPRAGRPRTYTCIQDFTA
jgi:ParB family chromosome partitioning protein